MALDIGLPDRGEIMYAFTCSEIGPRDVERINAYAFYELGKDFEEALLFEEDVAPHDAFWSLLRMERAVKKLLKGELVPLNLARVRVQKLSEEIQVLYNSYFSREVNGRREMIGAREDQEPIPSWHWDMLKTAIKNLETVLSDEMQEAATYYVPRRGIYSTPALVDSAYETFPETLRGHIPEKSIADWNAAGRCLAFSLLTASGFHAARAVEGTLEAYYQALTGKLGHTLRSWHDYIQALGKIAADAKTLSELDQMRTYDRNPIMHPRIVLSEGDARVMFNNSESLIIAMAQEIKRVKDAGGLQPELVVLNGEDIESPF